MLLFIILCFITIAIVILYYFKTKIQIYKLGILKTSLNYIFIVTTWDKLLIEFNLLHFDKNMLFGYINHNFPIILFFQYIAFVVFVIVIHLLQKHIWPRDILQKWDHKISFLAAILCILVTFYHLDQTYTAMVFLIFAFLLMLQVFAFRNHYMSKYWVTFLILILPLFLIDCLLIQVNVFHFNQTQILNQKFLANPLDQIALHASRMLIAIWFYERYSLRKQKQLKIIED